MSSNEPAQLSRVKDSTANLLPAFELHDARGTTRSFPSARTALLCFVKEDCPTCGLTMPLIEAAHRAFGASIDVWAIGQDGEGNAKLVERHALTVPMLDDSALKVSFEYGLDTVPTIILADAHGHEQRRFVGFGRDDWREMFAELARQSGLPPPAVDWDSYPESRPGCGSKSVEPGIAERLEANARGDKLTARRIELGEAEDVFEFMFERGLTDGLPVVPPTPERVMWMLTGTRRDPRDVVAIAPPNLTPVTVEKVAVNAVMAGCRPAYLPVVIAALEAVCTDEFNVHGIMSTTWGATPVMVVNGPIRHRLDMNMGMMALGYGTRVQRHHRARAETDVAQRRRRATGRDRALDARRDRQVHDLLRRMGGAQSVGTAARRARLRQGRERGDGVRAGSGIAPDRRSDLTNARALAEVSAWGWKHAGIPSRTAPARFC